MSYSLSRLDFLVPKTIVPANISPVNVATTTLLTAASAKTAYDNPKQFLAVAAIAFTVGVVRGYFSVQNYMQAKETTEQQVKALQRLNPLADKKTALYLLVIGLASTTQKGQEVLQRLPAFASRVAISHLVAIPTGYNLGVFVAREVVSRFVGTDTQRAPYNADCQRQKLGTQRLH